MALYAFDGTWQDGDDALAPSSTNVTRFCEAYQGSRPPIYFAGPGTSRQLLGSSRRNLFSLAFRYLGLVGAPETEITLRRARAALHKSWVDGDRIIDLVGYSRGAATALVFAWILSEAGVTDPASGEVIARPDIRFLGLWDTVFFVMGNRGLPDTEQLKAILVRYRFLRALFARKFVRETGSSDLLVPGNVLNTYHALALHERGWFFRPARLHAAPDRLHEVWFAGAHGDLGGQSGNEFLSEPALRWMLDGARGCGVPVISRNAREGSSAESGPVSLPWDRLNRDIRSDDRYHSSVAGFTNGNDTVISSMRPE